MDQPNVTKLYKYRAFDAYSLSSLVDQTGWFATAASFNDPFDCNITISDAKLDESVHAALRQIQSSGTAGREIRDDDFQIKDTDRAAFKLAQQRLLETAQSLGVFCLSEVADHILMWSHYGDCHRGFCVEYGRDPDNSLGRLSAPVQYSAEYPQLGFPDITSNDSSARPSDILWLTKSHHWAYEREWRIMQGPGGKAYHLDFPITGVIFGMRMPESQKHTIYNIVASRWPAQFQQANRSDTHFQVHLTDWHPPNAS